MSSCHSKPEQKVRSQRAAYNYVCRKNNANQKRILDLIALAELLELKRGHYHFKIAGDGNELAQLTEHFERKKYSNVSIEFLGLVAHERMTDLWTSSEISILFSDFEGMSLSMLESMGQGCVPIVTDVSGSKEKITHGRTGFIVPIGDVGSMARIISDLEADRTRVEQISKACISSVREHGFDTYDQEFMKLMQECIVGPRAMWPATKAIHIPARPSIYRKLRGKAGNILRALKMR